METDDREFAESINRLVGVILREALHADANEVQIYSGEANAWVDLVSNSETLGHKPIPSRTLTPLVDRLAVLASDGGQFSTTVGNSGVVNVTVQINAESATLVISSEDL